LDYFGRMFFYYLLFRESLSNEVYLAIWGFSYQIYLFLLICKSFTFPFVFVFYCDTSCLYDFGFSLLPVMFGF
jgi:hypothetical protein